MSIKSKHLLPFLKPSHRTAIKILIDAGIAFGAYFIATVLQRATLHVDMGPLLGEMFVFSIFSTLMFLIFRTYRGIWSYVSLSDLFRLTIACVATNITYFGFREAYYIQLGLNHISFSQPIITGMVMLGGLCVLRIFYRLYHFGNLRDTNTSSNKTRILIIGAGDTAESFIRSIKQNQNSPYDILGILDPRKDRKGRTIHGIKVLGHPKHLEQVITQLKKKPQRLVFTNTDETKQIPLEMLIEEAEMLGLKFSQLPNVTEFKENDFHAPQLKPIAIEDLLGRPQDSINMAVIQELIKGKRVLITGAGGSIGSELTKQVASFQPSELTILDNSEYNLYTIDLDVRLEYPDLNIHTHIADIRNAERIQNIFNDKKPEIVFHAAALKHVPMVELNPQEGVLTNVIGTRNVVQAALNVKTHAFVQISTDKAVNPTNVMGASKRIGEYYAQALDLENKDTRFITVRFGNVLGSSGSVVPLFRKQLEAGGPITVTHKDIKRYFMTINEAVGLVLQASACAVEEGDKGRGLILVLDMKEPIKIIDVARQMIRLADLTPDEDIKIEVTGLRPGEKLYEELFDESEDKVITNIPSTFAAHPTPLNRQDIEKAIQTLEAKVGESDVLGIIQCIEALVPGFSRQT